MTDEQDIWLEEIRDCKMLKKKPQGVKKPPRGEIIPRKNFYDDGGISQDSEFIDEHGLLPYSLGKNKSLGIDSGTDRKLRTGKIKIDMRIDFHGLTLDRALDSLILGLTNAHERGLRCVLLVTGKGKNTKADRISIKSKISEWLKIASLSSMIVKYVDAIPRHGGTGALYVFLRRGRDFPRKKQELM
ncbi:MAG: Smr/MutS family protein [Rickettsiales bacterium]|jgi:DNA-nicking Smr family endonuclease|nr:Smr/MutS family protein [Rickettsiales bacterium]